MDENEKIPAREDYRTRRKAQEQPKSTDAYSVVCILQIVMCVILIVMFAAFTHFSPEAKGKLKTELSFLFDSSLMKTEGMETVNAIKELFSAPQNFLAVFSPVEAPDETTEKETAQTGNTTENESESSTTEESQELPDELTDEEAREYFEKMSEQATTTPIKKEGDASAAVLNFGASNSSALKLSKTTDKIISPVNSTHYTSEFGYRLNPITNKVAFHTGLDIGADTGDKIKAAYSGTVRKTGEDSRSGKYIILTHANNMETLYCHCSKILASQDAVIRQGETIALVGSTGWSTGPHLHFEVKQNGNRLDPKKLLEEK